MFNLNEQQQKEIATICERTVVLKLSDADCERLANKCGKVGLTVSELLESFIGDLVDGTYSNGSDESMFADNWFERCGFSMSEPDTLLKHLLKNGDEVGDFLIACDEMDFYKEHPGEFADDVEEYGVEGLWFNVDYENYTRDFIEKYPNKDMQKEIENCRKWLADLNKFKGI